MLCGGGERMEGWGVTAAKAWYPGESCLSMEYEFKAQLFNPEEPCMPTWFIFFQSEMVLRSLYIYLLLLSHHLKAILHPFPFDCT